VTAGARNFTQMDANEAFKLQAGQMERDQVRVDMTKEGMLANKGKLRAAREMLDALRREDLRQPVPWQANHGHAMRAPAKGRVHAANVGDSSAAAQATAKKHGAGKGVGTASGSKQASKQAGASVARPQGQAPPQARAAPAPTAAPAASHVMHVTKEGVDADADAAVVAKVLEGKGAAAGKRRLRAEPLAPAAPAAPPRSLHLASHGKEEAASRRAFSRAVDSIGMPSRALAEDQAGDEGGSPGREMELASSAVAVETPHGIVDKPYRCANPRRSPWQRPPDPCCVLSRRIRARAGDA
jgi:hypothetical protein